LYCRHDDLKSMLDSSKDNLKLEAMKRIIGVCLSFDVLARRQQLAVDLHETVNL